MAQSVPCPSCGAPIEVDLQVVGTDFRCPCCGFPFRASVFQGTVYLSPVQVSQAVSPKRLKRRKPIEWQATLALLIPLASLALIIGAIAIREIGAAKQHNGNKAREITSAASPKKPNVARQPVPLTA